MAATHCHIKLVLSTLAILIVTSFLIGCSTTDENSPIGYQTSGAEDRFNLKISIDATPCPLTTIAFDLPTASFVDLDILNATGYIVRNLYHDNAEAGSYGIEWDATNDDGKAVETGIYLIRLRAGQFEQTKVTSLCLTLEDCEEMHGE